LVAVCKGGQKHLIWGVMLHSLKRDKGEFIMEKTDIKEIKRHKKESNAKMSVRKIYRRAAKRGKHGKQLVKGETTL
jgi:hypothetical protein